MRSFSDVKYKGMDLTKGNFNDHVESFILWWSFWPSGYHCLDPKNITTIAVTAFLVVFQPELRKSLNRLGSQNLLSGILLRMTERVVRNLEDRTVINFVQSATFETKENRALIYHWERGTLKEIERPVFEISGLVKQSQLLHQYF